MRGGAAGAGLGAAWGTGAGDCRVVSMSERGRSSCWCHTEATSGASAIGASTVEAASGFALGSAAGGIVGSVVDGGAGGAARAAGAGG